MNSLPSPPAGPPPAEDASQLTRLCAERLNEAAQAFYELTPLLHQAADDHGAAVLARLARRIEAVADALAAGGPLPDFPGLETSPRP